MLLRRVKFTLWCLGVDIAGRVSDHHDRPGAARCIVRRAAPRCRQPGRCRVRAAARLACSAPTVCLPVGLHRAAAVTFGGIGPVVMQCDALHSWGIVLYGEIKGRRNLTLLGIAFFVALCGIICIVLSKTLPSAPHALCFPQPSLSAPLSDRRCSLRTDRRTDGSTAAARSACRVCDDRCPRMQAIRGEVLRPAAAAPT